MNNADEEWFIYLNEFCIPTIQTNVLIYVSELMASPLTRSINSEEGNSCMRCCCSLVLQACIQLNANQYDGLYKVCIVWRVRYARACVFFGGECEGAGP